MISMFVAITLAPAQVPILVPEFPPVIESVPCCVPCPQPPQAQPVPQAPQVRQAYRREDVVLRFNLAALAAIRAERTPPPIAARNLAIMHIAVFDAINIVERTHRPYRVGASLPGVISVEAAAAVAAHRSLVGLFPQQKALFDAELDAALQPIPNDGTRRRGIELGKFVAEEMLTLRALDGHDRQVNYTPGKLPGEWQPTPTGFKPALLPQWGLVMPFALKSGNQFRPDGPPALRTPEYAQAYNEVKAIGAVDSKTRTRDQTEIAYFWRDDPGTCTPPGHWNLVAQEVARARGNTMAQNARLFALLNISLADAAISCWDAKYYYQFWRPVTAIRRADEVKHPLTEADRNWMPLINTPPFPTYTSGHSTFSGAGATALALFFGTDRVPFTVGSDELRDVRRSYTGFWAAAQEAGKSRIYGGIHWEFDNAEGLHCGQQIAEFVYKNFLTPVASQQVLRPQGR